jgi:hypothetical protein
MSDLNQSDIEIICKQLFDELQGILSWKWDDWIGTILTEFSAEKIKNVRATLEKVFPISYDKSNINAAPQIVQTLDKHLGGLRSTQLLFTSNPSREALVFGAWWPWGNGETISLRVAIFNRNISKSEEDKLIEQLKVWAEI